MDQYADGIQCPHPPTPTHPPLFPASYHNIAFQMRLMRDMRAAIEADALPAFVQDFMATAHPDGEYPQWAVDALAAVDIALAPPSVQAADDDPNAGVADMNATST